MKHCMCMHLVEDRITVVCSTYQRKQILGQSRVENPGN